MRWLIFVMIMSLLCIPVHALDNSTIYCVNNGTLMENITVYKDGNSSWYAIQSACENGCDNITFSCNPPEYVQSVFNFGLIAVFILACIIIYRWRR
jgi:hypothetical protein